MSISTSTFTIAHYRTIFYSEVKEACNILIYQLSGTVPYLCETQQELCSSRFQLSGFPEYQYPVSYYACRSIHVSLNDPYLQTPISPFVGPTPIRSSEATDRKKQLALPVRFSRQRSNKGAGKRRIIHHVRPGP